MSNITVLCKVVDNYGDIGVAHRLCMELAGECTITLVVDDLTSYHAICPAIDPALPMQQAGGITVLDWNDTAACLAYYTECGRFDTIFADGENHSTTGPHPPSIILQCFQCGYPQWMEEMLFDKRLEDDVYVIDIDYLTAEDWAGEFHKMASLTRSSHVHKSLFMPGFTPQTGGLLLQGRTRAVKGIKSNSTILVFGYARDYSPLIDALSAVNYSVMAAAGAGQASFLAALNKAEHPPVVEVLPMLPQTEWDAMLLGVDAAFVRGEDSLAGAALAGVPFVWQAYPQEGGAHLKKVEALLERMRPHFTQEQYELLHSVWMMWNKTTADVCETATDRWLSAADRMSGLLSSDSVSKHETTLCRFLAQIPSLALGFARFADCIAANGDMAQNLAEYISKM